MRARHEHATSASRSSADGYERHRPEETVLYTALQAHWKTFVSELEAVAEPPVLPEFVVAKWVVFLMSLKNWIEREEGRPHDYDSRSTRATEVAAARAHCTACRTPQ